MVYIFINVNGLFFIVPSCMLGEPFPQPLKTIMLAVMHMNSFSHDGYVKDGEIQAQWPTQQLIY